MCRPTSNTGGFGSRPLPSSGYHIRLSYNLLARREFCLQYVKNITSVKHNKGKSNEARYARVQLLLNIFTWMSNKYLNCDMSKTWSYLSACFSQSLPHLNGKWISSKLQSSFTFLSPLTYLIHQQILLTCPQTIFGFWPLLITVYHCYHPGSNYIISPRLLNSNNKNLLIAP